MIGRPVSFNISIGKTITYVARGDPVKIRFVPVFFRSTLSGIPAIWRKVCIHVLSLKRTRPEAATNVVNDQFERIIMASCSIRDASLRKNSPNEWDFPTLAPEAGGKISTLVYIWIHVYRWMFSPLQHVFSRQLIFLIFLVLLYVIYM